MLVFKDASICKNINSLARLPPKVNGMGGDRDMIGGYKNMRVGGKYTSVNPTYYLC